MAEDAMYQVGVMYGTSKAKMENYWASLSAF